MSWLRFTMNLNDDPSSLEEIHDSYQTLVKGQLAIMEKDEAKNIYEATSGFPLYQFISAQSLIGRGPIPCCGKVGIPAYTVSTLPFDLTSEAKSEENFYLIEPNTVDADGVKRGSFAIQFDDDPPGSAGSIGLINAQDWQKLQAFMADYHQQGFESIDLIVEYNNIAKPSPISLSESVFTVESPTPETVHNISKPLTFSGMANASVTKIITTVSAEVMFIIGEVEPMDGQWKFEIQLDSTEENLFKFRALDRDGNLLQNIEFSLILDED